MRRGPTVGHGRHVVALTTFLVALALDDAVGSGAQPDAPRCDRPPGPRGLLPLSERLFMIRV